MKTRIIYSLLALLFFGMYWNTWKGALLFMGILGGCLAAYLIISYLRRHKVKYLVSIVAIATGGLIVFGGHIISSVFTGGTALTTLELKPFTFPMAMGNFSVLTLLIPVILAILVYKAAKQGDANTIFLLVWSVIMLVVMLEYRRFAYYFSVNVALLTGWFVWYTWQKLKKQDILRVMVVCVICLVAIIPNIQVATARRGYFSPSDAWCSTMTWVKENTRGDSIILSWWDYGFWISRIGQREAYVNPGQDPKRIAETARLFLSPDGKTSINHDYIILDQSITTGKFWAVILWADLPEEDFYEWVPVQGGAQIIFHPKYYQSLAVRLYNFNGQAVLLDTLIGTNPFMSSVPLAPVGQYTLVYQSEQKIRGIPEVKVFYKRKIIDGQ